MCLNFSSVHQQAPKAEDDESENSSDASENADQVGVIHLTNSMEEFLPILNKWINKTENLVRHCIIENVCKLCAKIFFFFIVIFTVKSTR